MPSTSTLVLCDKVLKELRIDICHCKRQGYRLEQADEGKSEPKRRKSNNSNR